MLIIGLGSNLGDRLGYLRQAYQLLAKIPELSIDAISPVYESEALLPPNAIDSWKKPYLNAAIGCHTVVEPRVLFKMIKTIELQIGRKPSERWAPRTIDIDLLAWDEMVIEGEDLVLPHRELIHRPFALWPLADLAPFWRYPLPGVYQGETAEEIVSVWGSRFDGSAPLSTRQIAHRIEGPILVGILNVSPDSFSDGGLYASPDAALKMAKVLIESGAEVIDIGAVATGPNAQKSVSVEDEWSRLLPVFSVLKEAQIEMSVVPKISLDTMKASIVEKAMMFGIDWVNDQTALADPSMRDVVLGNDLRGVIMHHMKIPEDRTVHLPCDGQTTECVYRWAKVKIEELMSYGFGADQIIFDPGIGFGKLAPQSWQIIQEISRFKSLEVPIMVGHSRKSFYGRLTSIPVVDRDLETASTSVYLAGQGIDYLRIHNVSATRRALSLRALLNVRNG